MATDSEMEVGGGKLVGQRANWWRTSPLPPAATFLATALFTVGFIALFTGMGVGAWYVITDPESPAPAAAQTTSQSTNVRNIDTGDAWTQEEYVDTSQGQRNSG